jgi:erythromycin esterase
VEEVRNMIEWMRKYNLSVPDEKRVKFLGYDLQLNDNGWKELKQFYSKVNPDSIKNLDSLQSKVESGIRKVNQSFIVTQANTGSQKLQNAYHKCLEVMCDIIVNEGQYQLVVGKELYKKSLLNIKLIIQEIKSFKDGFNNQRDYYMAQNIMYLLNQEKPDAKVVVWAHNGHISKESGEMGGYLTNILRNEYYAIGFEFYSGSFQTKNMDLKIKSKDWEVMTVEDPPIESLPWYMNKTGKDKFFIDFRNTGAEKIKNFQYQYDAHTFGSMYSITWPTVYPILLTNFDGMIYIKQSTAAKNFTKVYL